MKFILSGKVDISKLYVSSTMLQISHDCVKFVGMFREDKHSERLKNVRLYFVEFIYCHSITKTEVENEMKEMKLINCQMC